MCNRYSAARREQIRQLAAEFFPYVEQPEDWHPSVNIPPTSRVPVVIAGTERPFRLMQWSTKEPQGLLMNARAETLAGRTLWKEAVAHRRCLMLANGFWEFETIGRHKQGHYFSLPTRPVFPIAAIWLPANGKQPDRCVMVTNEPNDLVRPFHDRMPTLLTIPAAKEWISDLPVPQERINQLCGPYPVTEMAQWRSTPEMNRNSYQDLAALDPWVPEPDLFG